MPKKINLGVPIPKQTWVLITPDGAEREVTSAGKTFQLNELYRLIECDTVQMIRLADGRQMWMDEEAKLKPTPPAINWKATELLALAGGIPGDHILGNVLIQGKARKTKKGG